MTAEPVPAADYLYSVPFDQRTPEMVHRHYHHMYPLLRAADDLIKQHNGQPHPINEPWKGGLTDREITRRALIEVGRPPRDEQDIAMATTYLDRLRDEMHHMSPPVQPDLAGAIISAEFQYAGCVTTAAEFAAMNDTERQEHVDFLAEEIEHRGKVEDHLRELLTIALPTLYSAITEADEATREKAQIDQKQARLVILHGTNPTRSAP